MKKNYLLIAVFMAACVGSLSVKAQTDVTATYLANAGFDTTPICYTVAGGTTLTAGVTRIGTLGWIFEIPGWTNASNVPGNAVQVATGEYGTVANAQGFNNVAVPATDKYGVNTGACLSMSAGWGDKASYYQTATLPAGRYALKYNTYNAFTVAAIVSNYCGFIPTTGTATYSTRLTFPATTWVSDSISFYLTAETEGKINLGMTTSSGGSGNGAKVFIDNVKLIYYGIDKSGLLALKDSATVMAANPQDVGTSTVYTELNTAIANAQLVYDNTGATAIEVVEQETTLKTAIANVHVAILLQSRITTWTTLPYNATSVILNQSFESDITVGWTNVGGFGRQANTSFAKKDGANYAEKWIASGTSLSNIKLSQTINNIPNGIYLLKASAMATQQTGNTFPGGAFIYANNDSTEVFATNDYSVITNVTNNSLNIGFVVKTTGNWVAMDNFQLSYVSNGSPYLIITPSSLSFGPYITQQTVNVKGGYLAADVTLSATSAFSLSKTSITAAEAMATAGVDVVLTSSATSSLPNDSLIIISGTARQKVLLTVTESITVSNKGYFFDQSIVSPFTLTVSGDLFSNTLLTAPAGITLSESTITPVEAQTGKAITVTWNQSSRIVDQYIYLTSGSKKDSVLVFAVNDNIISTWDGNEATGTGTKLTDFGWSQTLADGITAGPASFGDFNGGGTRLVAAASAAHTYRGKAWVGARVAYLRTWGNPATNVFNLAVNLEADKTYVFRGVSAWHNNETNPTFTYAVNTAKSNTGTSLGAMPVLCTVKQRGEDYGFEFTPTTTATHYLTVSSSAINDAMCGVDYLAIYPKVQIISGLGQTDSQLLSNVNAFAINGTLKVTGADSYVVYNVQGMKVADVKVNTANTSVSLKPGVYMVRTAGNAQKVLVK